MDSDMGEIQTASGQRGDKEGEEERRDQPRFRIKRNPFAFLDAKELSAHQIPFLGCSPAASLFRRIEKVGVSDASSNEKKKGERESERTNQSPANSLHRILSPKQHNVDSFHWWSRT